MPRERSLAQRVRALERSVSTAPASDRSRRELAPSAAPAEPPTGDGRDARQASDLETRLSSLEAEVAELSAGLQALRGYVGNVEHVNDAVERRANAALAAVERLESSAGTPPLASLEQDLREEALADEPVTAGDEDASSEADAAGESDGLLDRLDALR